MAACNWSTSLDFPERRDREAVAVQEILFPQPVPRGVQHERARPDGPQFFDDRQRAGGDVFEFEGDDVHAGGEIAGRVQVVVVAASVCASAAWPAGTVGRGVEHVHAVAHPPGGQREHAAELPAADDADRLSRPDHGRECKEAGRHFVGATPASPVLADLRSRAGHASPLQERSARLARVSKVLAVVSVLGRDQKGVVAQFATYLAERGVNIEDIEQRVVSGLFVMDMLVDLADLAADLSDADHRPDRDVATSSAWTSASTCTASGSRRRSPCSCSREDHCLARLIADHQRGLDCTATSPAVLSNHPVLEPMAKTAGLPFAWKSHDDLDAHFAWLGGELDRLGVDLVVLARYMRVLPPALVSANSASGSSTFTRRCCRVLPGRGPVPAGVRERRPRQRLHRPFRHRTTRRRPGHSPGRVPHRRRRRHAGRRQRKGPDARSRTC